MDPESENSSRPGPLWRHVLWAVGFPLFGVGFGWASASFRLGPDEYGMPLAVPGQVWSHLIVWTVTGLVSAAALRAVAARVPLHALEVTVLLLTFMGTRLSLGYRPGPLVSGVMVAAALMMVTLRCVLALRRGARD
ncbi:hypothetical protein DIZ27_44745 [Streptomyces sp. NWU339]|nr:hypothetical protein DIZ27_44745 [Streptomyces sp. NWU339]